VFPLSLCPSVPLSLGPSVPRSLGPSVPRSLGPSVPRSLSLHHSTRCRCRTTAATPTARVISPSSKGWKASTSPTFTIPNPWWVPAVPSVRWAKPKATRPTGNNIFHSCTLMMMCIVVGVCCCWCVLLLVCAVVGVYLMLMCTVVDHCCFSFAAA
jgi:hypothetical protein